MLVAVAAAQVTSWGILFYSFSVFLAPMQAEFGWSVTQLTGAYSLALLISGMAAMPVGRWLDRHGPRGLMTLGSIAATILVIAWSQVDGLLAFYIIWAGIGVVMATVFYEPAFYLVANWFKRLRGRALTVLTFIGGFASVIYIPLAAWLVSEHGWRNALLVLAGLLLVGTLPIHALMLRRNPADIGQEPDGGVACALTANRTDAREHSVTLGGALRDASFWWLNAAFILATMATMAMTVFLIPYLTSQGYSTAFAASAAGAIGLLGLPGRLIFTPLGSRVQRQLVTALIFVLQALSLIVLIEVQSTTGVILFVILFGAGFGAITPARAALVAELYGARHYGSIGGVLAMSTTGARALAPIGAGLLVVSLGSYEPMLWMLAAVSGCAAVAVLQTRPSTSSAIVQSGSVT
jgi:MFS family permease